jgi:hypothetical protein
MLGLTIRFILSPCYTEGILVSVRIHEEFESNVVYEARFIINDQRKEPVLVWYANSSIDAFALIFDLATATI